MDTTAKFSQKGYLISGEGSGKHTLVFFDSFRFNKANKYKYHVLD